MERSDVLVEVGDSPSLRQGGGDIGIEVLPWRAGAARLQQRSQPIRRRARRHAHDDAAAWRDVGSDAVDVAVAVEGQRSMRGHR
jgi:hypothetical protein